MLLDENDCFVFDCDGVLWVDDDPIPGAIDCIRGLQEAGKTVFFVTNSARKHRDTLVDKFNKLGFPDIPLSQIHTSASATASFLQKQGFSQTVFTSGSDGEHSMLSLFQY
jgi:HAD superfamily hydrolase (TIGR01450 family)